MIKTLLHIPLHFRGLWLSVFFSLICLCIYEWGLFRKEKLRHYLENKIERLQLQKKIEMQTWILLSEEIDAQGDPNWEELTLKKTLGVIRMGETKIVFRDNR